MLSHFFSFLSLKSSFKISLHLFAFSLMNLKVAAGFCFLIILFFNLGPSICRTDIVTGYEVNLVVPAEYEEWFIGRAFLMETEHLMPPNFRVALTVEATQGQYSCSLQVFLGEVRVWSSGHFSRFFTAEKCVLELTADGDLRLKGPTGHVGWRTGTSRQGVERLRILRSGNLALVDAFERTKWQSFNFPTDVMVLGQSLNVATHLTSFPPNSTFFYSFEIETQRIALYLNSPKCKYSYWEFKPPNNINLSFITLNAEGLDIFDDRAKKISTIPSGTPRPLRFMALGNKTGNLGLYSYSPQSGTFEASFRALRSTCDLPLACKPYGICTFSNSCSCIGFKMGGEEEICGGSEMMELEGVSSILRDGPKRVNVSKEECGEWCLEECKCAAALYYWGVKECYVYRVVIGVKQIEMGMGLSYMVKVPKGSALGRQKSGLKRWVLAVVGVVDGLVILAVSGGLGYYFIKRRRKNFMDTRDTHS
ncbi:EP1-like glycoprotein 3 [Benincasa hispida]|uniref:EP1-like glycoprotein 3 n=1 Tax=Benincasa hispida TaxID=102211 RepID=UPI001901FBBF|nr:EP1-like glycoprotein 3 [Benincasa hispida]